MRVSSKADCLPKLEQPIKTRKISHRSKLIEVSGLGEGGNNLARLSVAQYSALVLMGVLAAILVLPFQ